MIAGLSMPCRLLSFSFLWFLQIHSTKIPAVVTRRQTDPTTAPIMISICVSYSETDLRQYGPELPSIHLYPDPQELEDSKTSQPVVALLIFTFVPDESTKAADDTGAACPSYVTFSVPETRSLATDTTSEAEAGSSSVITS